VKTAARPGATLLHIHLHHFEPNGGVSGVAVLAESHISIHSWPKRGYAALDIFMFRHGQSGPACRCSGKPSGRSGSR
jgi:S-adenosylmethionine decarboxylase proenzyme